jgi:hypothetical protein
MRRGPSTTAKWLLFLSASILVAGSSVHGIACKKAADVTQRSSLPPFYQAVLKGVQRTLQQLTNRCVELPAVMCNIKG